VDEDREAADVLVVGPLAPPRGGVSTHLDQLLGLLPEHGLSVAALNHRSAAETPVVLAGLHRNPLRYWWHLRRPRGRLVHYHFSRLDDLVAVAGARRRLDECPFVLTVHGNKLADSLESTNLIRRRAARGALKRFDAVIAVSPRIAAGLEPYVDSGRLSVVPAYLRGAQGPGELSDQAAQLVETGSPTLVVSAYQIAFLDDGSDLYGIDSSIGAFIELGARHPALALLIFVAKPVRGRRATRFMAEQRRRLADAGLEQRFAVCIGEPLTPVFAHDVIYLRPSRRDGDAISVREALAAGVPVIATDVAHRPASVRLVPAGDPEALVASVSDAIGSRANNPGDDGVAGGDGYLAGVLDVYARLLESPAGDDDAR
jgi:glycogen(starch) synthase